MSTHPGNCVVWGVRSALRVHSTVFNSKRELSVDPGALFQTISSQFVERQPDVEHGNMMRAPGLKCRDKVFAFFHNDYMCFRLGKGFDAEAYGIQNVRWLSPFKKKPPMKAWFIVEADESHLWEGLAHEALVFTRSLK